MNPSENWTNRFSWGVLYPIVCKVLKYKYEHILSCRRSRKRFLKESISIWVPHHIFVELYNLSEGTKTEISWVTVRRSAMFHTATFFITVWNLWGGADEKSCSPFLLVIIRHWATPESLTSQVKRRKANPPPLISLREHKSYLKLPLCWPTDGRGHNGH